MVAQTLAGRSMALRYALREECPHAHRLLGDDGGRVGEIIYIFTSDTGDSNMITAYASLQARQGLEEAYASL
jgi:hypothetical protein